MNNKMYTCEMCDYSTKTKCNYDKHLKCKTHALKMQLNVCVTVNTCGQEQTCECIKMPQTNNYEERIKQLEQQNEELQSRVKYLEKQNDDLTQQNINLINKFVVNKSKNEDDHKDSNDDDKDDNSEDNCEHDNSEDTCERAQACERENSEDENNEDTNERNIKSKCNKIDNKKKKKINNNKGKIRLTKKEKEMLKHCEQQAEILMKAEAKAKRTEHDDELDEYRKLFLRD